VIRSLRLVDFRCFEALSLELLPEKAVFVGGNAQGKTSLLEAICVLVRLHSPRTHRLGQLQRFAQSGFGVAGECWGEERRVSRSPDGIEMRIQGEGVNSQSDYLASGGLLVWMGNEDLELVRGPGEVRRRFLDFVATQLEGAYRQDLARYRRALRARNLLLKDRRPDEGQISAYTEILIEHGEALQEVRARLVGQLNEPVREAHRAISGVSESVSLEYRGAGAHDLRAAYEQAAERERRQGNTVVGPHRDDLILNVNALPAADYGSEGQQRTLALALKLGQGALLERERGSSPIYLIDDIFGELDTARRNALMESLPAGAQKLITTTSLEWLGRQAPPLFRVQSGTVSAE
jgi:DNA replication and repair protein RecF